MSQTNIEQKPDPIAQAIDDKRAPLDITPDDPSDIFEKMKLDVDKHLAERKQPPGSDAVVAKAGVSDPTPAPPAPPPPPAPAPAPVEKIPLQLKARALAAGWHESELGDDAASLDRAVSKVEQREAALLRRAATAQPLQQKPAESPPAEKKPTLEEVWGQVKETYGEGDRQMLEALVGELKAVREENASLKKEFSPVKDWAERQHHEQQANQLTQICDAAGFSELGKGRPKPGTEAYRNHGIIGHLLAQDMKTYAGIGMALTTEELIEAAKGHGARLGWSKAAQAAAATPTPASEPEPEPEPEVEAPKRAYPPKDPVTGKFKKTERPETRQGQEPEEKGFDHAARKLHMRLQRQRLESLTGSGFTNGDIHDS